MKLQIYNVTGVIDNTLRFKNTRLSKSELFYKMQSIMYVRYDEVFTNFS